MSTITVPPQFPKYTVKPFHSKEHPFSQTSPNPNPDGWDVWQEDEHSIVVVAPCDTEEEAKAEADRLTKIAHNFVSGGHPNGPFCATCVHRSPDSKSAGWGWCRIHNQASVSPTGHCNQHVAK